MSSAQEEVLKEIKALREKIERVEEIVEERLIGLEEPLGDEAKAIEGYLKAKKRRDIKLIPLEDVGGKA